MLYNHFGVCHTQSRGNERKKSVLIYPEKHFSFAVEKENFVFMFFMLVSPHGMLRRVVVVQQIGEA
jgi:hypothetical protein